MQKNANKLFTLAVLFPMVFFVGYAQQSNTPVHPDAQYAEAVLLNKPLEGFQGIWYANQPSSDEYVYKYSGGLGTYPSNHYPFSIYSPEVNKTFFCYGGVNEEGSLIHAVSFFDHRTKQVARPVAVLDKRTNDAHDNPVMSMDKDGYIWLFSTSHGVWRPSYIHRSVKPYDISEFKPINAVKTENGSKVPMDNFSYVQMYYQPGAGFFGLFTHYEQKELAYGSKQSRIISYMTSPDGEHWSEWKDIATIEEGHYQTSFYKNGKVATTFNHHPNIQNGSGLNYRTNLYYLETTDFGNSWQNIQGENMNLPLTAIENSALVKDYASLGLNVYINDVSFDEKGYPAILYVTSGGYEAGPSNNPRTWNLAYWTGSTWIFSEITSSDNNYDMGSIYLEADGTWRIIGPTLPGPQLFNTGGEMVMWISKDKGKTWKEEKVLTSQSEKNHSYARKPINAHADFYAFWADGHGRQPSESSLYFSTKGGKVFRLPQKMDRDMMKLKGVK
ncbi:BNR-4 repeat-containing protein [Lunatimonas salinarum]|uniref:BNR-4 repeat-containing protein n=1 Tax=Lunatimonas salinarum TaxID=1774590 RepID=UPI001FD85C23|nr:BNR-4 repeat-containing protein [Lunatimonas salinarum]